MGFDGGGAQGGSIPPRRIYVFGLIRQRGCVVKIGIKAFECEGSVNSWVFSEDGEDTAYFDRLEEAMGHLRNFVIYKYDTNFGVLRFEVEIDVPADVE